MRIIAIEDSAQHLPALELLREAGHDLTVFTSAWEATKYFEALGLDVRAGNRANVPDMLLTDLYLPKRDFLGEGSWATSVHDAGDGDTTYFNGSLDGEAPYGMVFAANAFALGIEHVAIVTSAHHHDDALILAAGLLVNRNGSPVYWRADGYGEVPMTRDGAKNWPKICKRLLDPK